MEAVKRVLITGSRGLVGSSISKRLRDSGYVAVGLDIRGDAHERGDVCDAVAVAEAMQGCDGVIHLAAVSRVVWGERAPEECWRVNVGGTATVTDAAASQSQPPWVIFSSSREVYGEPEKLPVHEDAPLRPVNVYGRSKAEGERLVMESRSRGVRGVVIRLSNVYGSVLDHHDRVVPAFARAAATGERIRIDGESNTFDFTHIHDVTRGIGSLVDKLCNDKHFLPPPVHFLTGRGTSLGELAEIARHCSNDTVGIDPAPSRSFDVSRFRGDPRRASELLDWTARIGIEEGVLDLVEQFRRGGQT